MKRPSNNKKNEQQEHPGVIAWAYFVRYGMLFLPLLAAGLLYRSGLLSRKYALFAAAGLCVLEFLYYLAGFSCRWRHMYCVWQNISHQKMTPNKIDWRKVDRKDITSIPFLFLLLGALLAFAGLFS